MNKKLISKYISPKKLFRALLLLWLLFVSGYFIYDKAEEYLETRMQKSYENGVNDSIDTLIEEANKCRPVPLVTDNDVVTLIAVECLESETNQ